MEGFADLACRAAAFAGERVGERLGGAVVGKAGEHLAEAAAVRTAEKLLGRCAIGLYVLSEPELLLRAVLARLVCLVIAPLLNQLYGISWLPSTVVPCCCAGSKAAGRAGAAAGSRAAEVGAGHASSSAATAAATRAAPSLFDRALDRVLGSRLGRRFFTPQLLSRIGRFVIARTSALRTVQNSLPRLA